MVWGINKVQNKIDKWQHMFKLDPAKEINDEDLERVCKSGTDAIVVGGTDNVTLDGVLDLLYRIRPYALPCMLEISTMDAITPGFDAYLIPTVFNSQDKKWFVDVQHAALKEYGSFIDWDEVFVEGYCILNEQSKVYQKTNSKLPSNEDVLSYAMMAEHFFKLPIFYVEYSGRYGDVALVEQVKSQLDKTKLFYGGGIETLAQAIEMKQFADVIVVGNVIYSNIEAALETVKAVK